MTPPFIPDACDATISPDGRYVHLNFMKNDGSRITLDIPKTQFGQLVHVLQRRSQDMAVHGAASTHPTREPLPIIDSFHLVSDRGELVLEVYARVFEGNREQALTLPVPLSSTEAQKLRAALDHHLAAADIEPT